MKLTNLKYMEAKGSSGQSSVYNTYATPPTPNPLFQGFSRSQNVNKEIIIRTLGTLVNTGLQGFLFTQFQAFGAY